MKLLGECIRYPFLEKISIWNVWGIGGFLKFMDTSHYVMAAVYYVIWVFVGEIFSTLICKVQGHD
jgi:hypothetical protein